jgi:hypothetical protein
LNSFFFFDELYGNFIFFSLDEQAWIAAYKAETKKYFEAVLTNQKLDEIEKAERDQKIVPKRRILKQNNFTEYSKETFNPNLLDGFYLVFTNLMFVLSLLY